MIDIEEIILKNKVIPVIVTEDTQDVVTLGETLLKNGVNIIEITLRTKEAFQAILTLSKNLPFSLINPLNVALSSV